MKKTIILIIITVLCIILSFTYAYNIYTKNIQENINFNKEYEIYYQKETLGTSIATLINKAINNNEKNNIKKDNKGEYIEDETNSIKIDILITDNSTTYPMEKIYKLGAGKFVDNYSQIQFKCTKIEYHKNSGKVKYMLFEQITK